MCGNKDNSKTKRKKVSSLAKLFFKVIPKIYQKGEGVYLVGLDLSGIQKYIFSNTKNKKSLQEIKKRSLEIAELTNYLHETIHNKFPIKKEQIITLNSGKFIFTLKANEDLEELFALIKELQRDIFLTFNGSLNLFYGYVDAVVSDEIVHQEKTAYQELLTAIQTNKRQAYDLLNYNHKTDFNKIKLDITVQDGQRIDDLTDEESSQLVTGIKFDFDNLGAYFGRIGQSDEISKISKQMQDKIDRVLNNTKNIYKIFSGGDDIFVLTNFYQTFEKVLEIL